MNKPIYKIADQTAYEDYKEYLDSKPKVLKVKNGLIETQDYRVKVFEEYTDLLDMAKGLIEEKEDYNNDLIYGKDKTEGIVAVEIKDDIIWLFYNNGDVEKRPAKYWICSNKKLDKNFQRLKGNNHYNWVRTFTDSKEYSKFRGIYNKRDIFCVWNDVESQMISKGITLFKGLKVEDVSVLSFDIEGAGLSRHEDSKTFVITNTLNKNGKKTIKQFRVDNYLHQGQLIEAWCEWVREVDPTIINGHNVFGYDLDYLRHCASLYGNELILGRDGSSAKFGSKPKKYRVDGSQTWDYINCQIFGRHIVDGMFLAVKYDIGRNYPSWGLKAIAEYEGIVADDRQFYDASKIGKNWNDPIEREKIVKYCEHDGNDSMSLYELMIPSFFYMAQSIPKPFQVIINSASGAWLNTIMLRSYLQEFKSIPKASEKQYVGGGMSYGCPGVYDNVTKWDAKSYYPSTILTFDIYDPVKDPEGNYLEMVRHFTNKRFEQKRLYKETGNKYFDDLQASSKVFINSAYGLLGTQGLNFNNFEKAALITKACRKGLQKCILWATGKDYLHWWHPDDTLYKVIEVPKEDLSKKIDFYEGRCEVLKEHNGIVELYVPRRKTNGKYKVSYVHSDTARQDFDNFSFIDEKSEWSSEEMPRHDWVLVNIDTDSLSFAKKDGSPYTKEEYDMIHEEINKIMYSEWEPDGYFDRVVVSKAKNYVLKEGEKITFKGSSLTDQKKEPALLEMLDRLIKECFIYENASPKDIYHEYIKEALDIQDINRWATKKSITEKLFESDRANETKVVDAIEGLDVQMGDKVYLYNAIDGLTPKMVKGKPVILKKSGEVKMIPNNVLRVVEKFNGDYDKDHYIDRVRKTVAILENIIDMEQIPNYTSVKGKKLLEDL